MGLLSPRHVLDLTESEEDVSSDPAEEDVALGRARVEADSYEMMDEAREGERVRVDARDWT